MAMDIFIKIGDLKGESVDDKHKDEIQVLSWSWGLSQSGTTHAGPGGGAGKANFQDLSFTHFIDKASPNLMLYCANGKHFTEALLTVRKAGEKPLEYLKLTLSDLIITSVNTGGSGGEDRLTENVSLNFAKWKLEYTPQKKDGSGDAPITVAWNIAENKKEG
jgi:type VI secretion system secreted protein Hcp